MSDKKKDTSIQDFFKDILNTIVSGLKKLFYDIAKFIFKSFIKMLIVFILIIIAIITLNGTFSKKLKGTCIDADEFGKKKNQILAKPLNDSTGYLVNNNYKHEKIRQKVRHTDIGLSLNGDPVTINITGQWIPWIGEDYVSKISSVNNGNDEKLITLNSKLENGGLPDKSFFCALNRFTLNNSHKFSNKDEENEFYYIRNYYKQIIQDENKTENNIDIKVNGTVIDTITPGDKIIYGVEELPERQKECWLTGGAGLYLGSYGVNGKTQPSAYHHLMAQKMVCNKPYWFNGEITSTSDVITKYNKPTGKNWSSCKDAKGDSCTCDSGSKNEDLGTCSSYNGSSHKVMTYCDCKTYSEQSYTYGNFIENYFDVKYHLSSGSTITNEDQNNQILVDDGTQVIYNMEIHRKLLENNLPEAEKDNIGYIIASSMEKFATACYLKTKDIEGGEKREYKSFFQFGPKVLYKNVSESQNIKYAYGEKVRMFILDKYYDDNSGFYNIEVVSGVELDDVGSFEGKIQEVEFFLLGTPHVGSSNDRTDGIVAIIFNNILSSGFVRIARILMVFMVVFFGFRVIFGFKTKQDGKEGALNRRRIFSMIIKTGILVVLMSESAFQFFTTIVINFFVNGTIGIIDLIANIFPNGLVEDNMVSLINGMQNNTSTMSLAKNFAVVDEVLAFFDGHTLTAKVLSFTFLVGNKFFIGFIVSVMIFFALIFYLFKIVQSIIPFIFVILQLTLVLPLAPVCLAISLIDNTAFVLTGWIKFVLSKCMELIAFFTAFYLCTSIISNFIKTMLSFKVCFIGLGSYLMPNVDDEISVDGFVDFFKGSWLKELIKKILNNFIAAKIDTLPNNWFLFYCINITLTFLAVYMFDIMTKSFMDIMSKIISIDGASTKAEKNPMGDATGGKFGVSNMLVDFAKTTGLQQMQKKSDLLSWTRNIYDLDKGVGENAKHITKAVLGFGNKLMDIPLDAAVDAATGAETHAGQDFKRLMGSTAEGIFGEKLVTDSIAKGSSLDYTTWGKDGSPSAKTDPHSLALSRRRDENKIINTSDHVSDEYSAFGSPKEAARVLRKRLDDSKTRAGELKHLGKLLDKESVGTLEEALKAYDEGKITRARLDMMIDATTERLRMKRTDVERGMASGKLKSLDDKFKEIIGDRLDRKENDKTEEAEEKTEEESKEKQFDSTAVMGGEDSTVLTEEDTKHIVNDDSTVLTEENAVDVVAPENPAAKKEDDDGSDKLQNFRQQVNERIKKQQASKKKQEETKEDKD